MSLSDEAIYDIVAHAVGGDNHNCVRSVAKTLYDRDCLNFASKFYHAPRNTSVAAPGVEYSDMKRLARAVRAYKGEGCLDGDMEEQAIYRQDYIAVRDRIKKLFGTSPQPTPEVSPVTLLDTDRVRHYNGVVYTVQELRSVGWTDAHLVKYCDPVKLTHTSFDAYLQARKYTTGDTPDANEKRYQAMYGAEPVAETSTPDTSPMTAAHTLKTAADLVGGDRNASHGDMTENHQNIASLWEGYLGMPIKPHDVAVMMCLLKIARTKSGRTNPDDYVDLAGYAGIAAEIKSGENNA